MVGNCQQGTKSEELNKNTLVESFFISFITMVGYSSVAVD